LTFNGELSIVFSPQRSTVERVNSVEIIEPKLTEEPIDIVVITKEEYKRLRDIERQYNHLINTGVDNWENYTYLGDGT